MSTLDPRRLLANDPVATQAFLEFTRRFIRRYLQDPSRVREVSQSALAEMLAKLERGLGPKPDRVHYWVAASASNAVRRELTRMRHRAVTYESRLHNQPAADQDDVFMARREVERIEGLLAQFSGRARRVLLASARGQTTKEIADELQMSPDAVRTTVSRARRKLRKDLTAEQRLERMKLVAKAARRWPHLLASARSGSSRR